MRCRSHGEGQQQMKKWMTRLAAVMMTLSLALTGCGGSTSQPGSGGSGDSGKNEPIRIGFFADVTGGAASLGKTEANTAQLVEEMLNEKGGINGRPVEIEIIDSKSQEQEAVLAIKKLIDNGAVAIVGGTTTGATMAAVPTAETEEVPFISMAAGVGIVRPTKKWVFKTPQTDELALLKIFEYLEAKGITRVAWISSNNAYGDSGRAEFEKLAPQHGLEVVASERFNLDDKDMTAQLTRIKAANPQAVINWSIPPTASIVTRNFHDLGFGDTVLIQSHGVANGAFLEQSGEAANGVILPAGTLLVVDSMPDDNPRKKVIKEFMAAYQEKFGEPVSGFSGYAYDGLMLVAKAIETAGADRAKIRDALEAIKDYPGVTGTFTMSPDDHMGLIHGDSFELVEVRGGKFEPWNK